MDMIDHPVRPGSGMRSLRTERLRVTVAVDAFPALSETFVLDQVVGLIEMGHDVRIIADAPRNERTVHDEVAEYDLLSKTRYLKLDPRSKRRRIAAFSRALRSGRVQAVRSLNAFRLTRKQTGETGCLAGLAVMIAALAEAPRPDVILCHFGPNGARAARALEALRWTVPIVTLFHGFDLTRLVQQRGPKLYDNLFRNGTLFFPVCNFFADRLRAMGCPPERIMVQRMCVDVAKLDRIISLLKPREPPREAFTFVMVGRLVPKKGFAHAIRAFAQAFAHLPRNEIRLRIVGDGPLRGELENLARVERIEDRVEFLGSLRRPDVLSTVLTADALIQPSIVAPDGDMEGSPVVISEAMALCKPVIGTRHSGIPDLIVHDITGKLVDEGDEAAAAEAMTWMMANRSAAQRMGQAGRKRLEAGFDASDWNALLEQRLRDVATCQTRGRLNGRKTEWSGRTSTVRSLLALGRTSLWTRPGKLWCALVGNRRLS
jgi:colanic acid/amylovoran/stewartan biosynthesis glycosyltransferase WcaL/AmsK/CpsK